MHASNIGKAVNGVYGVCKPAIGWYQNYSFPPLLNVLWHIFVEFNNHGVCKESGLSMASSLIWKNKTLDTFHVLLSCIYLCPGSTCLGDEHQNNCSCNVHFIKKTNDMKTIHNCLSSPSSCGFSWYLPIAIIIYAKENKSLFQSKHFEYM